MSAIRIEGLVKRYGPVRALDGLDLTVDPGTVFGFLGPNGAGKTTTMRILTGLARPTAGQATIHGAAVGGPDRSVARTIGHLPEEPAFYSWMTAVEQVDYIARLFDLPAAERRARSAELLDLVGLSAVAGRRIAGFSRGMRQRLGLALALVNRPAVLLLDEPVSALDPAGRKEVLELVDRLRGQCTVFMSTHILADVERICDTVAIVANGRLVTQAPRAELLDRYALPIFEVESDTPNDGLASWTSSLRGLPWIVAASNDGPVLRIEVSDVATAKRELLPGALAAGVTVIRYQLLRPSLEEVFLRLVSEGAR